ncbi:hypothetical protein [Spirosoma flavum]|uniref:TFIIB-type zinc ribbon-containing protein n=1 Tax=Spirosoma flavum TaxID=2048557 RepID=A0ABW6ARR3_9BACT
MNNVRSCPKCGSDKLVALGEEKASSVVSFTEEEEEQELADLFGNDNRDRRCLNCGYSWNVEAQLLQQQEDQDQMNALSFEERKENFYNDYESGHLAQAKEIVPIEASGVYKRKGLKAAYRYLKLLDIKLDRFKNRSMLVVIAVILVLVGIIVYACS